MTKDNEQYAYFTITGDFEPSTISERLGLEPTSGWKKGDRNEKTHLERKFSRWSLRSRLNDLARLEEHIRDVLSQLEGKIEKVRALSAEYGTGEIACAGYFHSSYPGFTLERDLISAMASMNLELDCDFYYLYSDRRDDS